MVRQLGVPVARWRVPPGAVPAATRFQPRPKPALKLALFRTVDLPSFNPQCEISNPQSPAPRRWLALFHTTPWCRAGCAHRPSGWPGGFVSHVRPFCRDATFCVSLHRMCRSRRYVRDARYCVSTRMASHPSGGWLCFARSTSRVCPYGQTKTVPTGLRWLCFARLGDVLSHSTTKGLQPGVGFVSQNQSRSQ